MNRPPSYLTGNAKRLRSDSTEAEQRLWYHLRAKRLNGLKFKRQQPIGGYIVDFCCFEPPLVVEVDGGQHATDYLADRERSAFLRGRGFEVIRFWNSEVLSETEAVLERIVEKVQELSDSPLPDPLPEGEGTVSEGVASYGWPIEKNGLYLREKVQELSDSPLPDPLPEGEGTVSEGVTSYGWPIEKNGLYLREKVQELSDSPHPDPLPAREGTVEDGAATYRESPNLNPLSLRERATVRGNQMLPSISTDIPTHP
jgi:very-short-patch-repair endonuclease